MVECKSSVALLCNRPAPALDPVFMLSWHLEIVDFRLQISTVLSLLLNYKQKAYLCDLVLSSNNSSLKLRSDWIAKIVTFTSEHSGQTELFGVSLGKRGDLFPSL